MENEKIKELQKTLLLQYEKEDQIELQSEKKSLRILQLESIVETYKSILEVILKEVLEERKK